MEVALSLRDRKAERLTNLIRTPGCPVAERQGYVAASPRYGVRKNCRNAIGNAVFSIARRESETKLCIGGWALLPVRSL